MEVGARACCLAAALLLASSLASGAPRHSPVPGGIALIELPADATGARFEGAPVLIIGRRAVVGLPLSAEPGPQVLELDDGRGIHFAIEAKTYPTQQVWIKDQGKVELSAENELRVAGELAEINRLKRRFNPLATPDLDFVAPARGRRSGRFGARRIFNGLARAPHVGLDFSVPRGTPIVSAGAGTVLATADYFFNGKTVFVDHGQGLISMYCHLDQIEVAAGQSLRRGERLGRAGSSGRASGPHLHWSVILNGAMVDPELLLPRAEPIRSAPKKSAPASP